MAKTAAMVQGKVVKGGGAGSLGDMDCADILACFDPPIEFGSHKDLKKIKGYQKEHVIPASAHHQSGRSGTRMGGSEGYSTSGALCWNAWDNQLKNTMHKLLTNAMRVFSQENDLAGRRAPLREWLDKYRDAAKNALKNGLTQRTIKRTDLDPIALTDAAAECIRRAAEAAYAQNEPPVEPETELRNPWPATQEMRNRAASEAASGSGGSPL